MATPLLSLLISIISILTVSSFTGDDAWKTYTFTEEHYAIDFPDNPVSSQKEIASPMGPLLMKIQLRLSYSFFVNSLK